MEKKRRNIFVCSSSLLEQSLCSYSGSLKVYNKSQATLNSNIIVQNKNRFQKNVYHFVLKSHSLIKLSSSRFDSSSENQFISTQFLSIRKKQQNQNSRNRNETCHFKITNIKKHVMSSSKSVSKETNMLFLNKKKETLKIFFNFSFDKGRLKNFVLWFLKIYGQKKTIELLEQFKEIGFSYATKAGISLGIDDLKIPPQKTSLLELAQQKTDESILKYKRGEITGIERLQKFIETWHETSENLKKEVVRHFESTDVLNPVYMMAFSGARGNLSQVRQLVGMRGLMADPQGQIIDFPIRSNFREGLTLTEYIISTYGARKGIVDTALRTANAGYLTRRLVDVAQHVIVSEFDCGTPRGIVIFEMKEGNKTIYSLENRLIGRILAKNVFFENKKVASRNDEISNDLAKYLTKISKKSFIRSPLTCQTKKFVCQLCYGWSLSSNRLVAVGEAVGVIAAQSIGEPGTQLTMRTFHTGGVFSGGISDQIIAQHDGIVEYNIPISGICVRTLQGDISFLTKSAGSLILKKSETDFYLENTSKHLDNFDQKNQFFSTVNTNQIFNIPPYTLLFARNGQKVLKKQIIAQLTSITTQTTQRSDAEQTIYSEYEGEIYNSSIDILKKKNEYEDISFFSWGWGYFWILAGKIYQFPIDSYLFAKTGDLVNKNSILNRIGWLSSESCFLKINKKKFLATNLLEQRSHYLKNKNKIYRLFKTKYFMHTKAYIEKQANIKSNILENTVSLKDSSQKFNLVDTRNHSNILNSYSKSRKISRKFVTTNQNLLSYFYLPYKQPICLRSHSHQKKLFLKHFFEQKKQQLQCLINLTQAKLICSSYILVNFKHEPLLHRYIDSYSLYRTLYRTFVNTKETKNTKNMNVYKRKCVDESIDLKKKQKFFFKDYLYKIYNYPFQQFICFFPIKKLHSKVLYKKNQFVFPKLQNKKKRNYLNRSILKQYLNSKVLYKKTLRSQQYIDSFFQYISKQKITYKNISKKFINQNNNHISNSQLDLYMSSFFVKKNQKKEKADLYVNRKKKIVIKPFFQFSTFSDIKFYYSINLLLNYSNFMTEIEKNKKITHSKISSNLHQENFNKIQHSISQKKEINTIKQNILLKKSVFSLNIKNIIFQDFAYNFKFNTNKIIGKQTSNIYTSPYIESKIIKNSIYFSRYFSRYIESTKYKHLQKKSDWKYIQKIEDQMNFFNSINNERYIETTQKNTYQWSPKNQLFLQWLPADFQTIHNGIFILSKPFSETITTKYRFSLREKDLKMFENSKIMTFSLIKVDHGFLSHFQNNTKIYKQLLQEKSVSNLSFEKFFLKYLKKNYFLFPLKYLSKIQNFNNSICIVNSIYFSRYRTMNTIYCVYKIHRIQKQIDGFVNTNAIIKTGSRYLKEYIEDQNKKVYINLYSIYRNLYTNSYIKKSLEKWIVFPTDNFHLNSHNYKIKIMETNKTVMNKFLKNIDFKNHRFFIKNKTKIHLDIWPQVRQTTSLFKSHIFDFKIKKPNSLIYYLKSNIFNVNVTTNANTYIDSKMPQIFIEPFVNSNILNTNEFNILEFIRMATNQSNNYIIKKPSCVHKPSKIKNKKQVSIQVNLKNLIFQTIKKTDYRNFNSNYQTIVKITRQKHCLKKKFTDSFFRKPLYQNKKVYSNLEFKQTKYMNTISKSKSFINFSELFWIPQEKYYFCDSFVSQNQKYIETETNQLFYFLVKSKTSIFYKINRQGVKEPYYSNLNGIVKLSIKEILNYTKLNPIPYFPFLKSININKFTANELNSKYQNTNLYILNQYTENPLSNLIPKEKLNIHLYIEKVKEKILKFFKKKWQFHTNINTSLDMEQNMEQTMEQNSISQLKIAKKFLNQTSFFIHLFLKNKTTKNFIQKTNQNLDLEMSNRIQKSKKNDILYFVQNKNNIVNKLDKAFNIQVQQGWIYLSCLKNDSKKFELNNYLTYISRKNKDIKSKYKTHTFTENHQSVFYPGKTIIDDIIFEKHRVLTQYIIFDQPKKKSLKTNILLSKKCIEYEEKSLNHSFQIDQIFNNQKSRFWNCQFNKRVELPFMKDNFRKDSIQYIGSNICKNTFNAFNGFDSYSRYSSAFDSYSQYIMNSKSRKISRNMKNTLVYEHKDRVLEKKYENDDRHFSKKEPIIALLIQPMSHKLLPNSHFYKRKISWLKNNPIDPFFSILKRKFFHSNLLNKQKLDKKLLSIYPGIDFKMSSNFKTIGIEKKKNHKNVKVSGFWNLKKTKKIQSILYKKEYKNLSKFHLKRNTQNYLDTIFGSPIYLGTFINKKLQSFNKYQNFSTFIFRNNPFYFSFEQMYLSYYPLNFLNFQFDILSPLSINYPFNNLFIEMSKKIDLIQESIVDKSLNKSTILKNLLLKYETLNCVKKPNIYTTSIISSPNFKKNSLNNMSSANLSQISRKIHCIYSPVFNIFLTENSAYLTNQRLRSNLFLNSVLISHDFYSSANVYTNSLSRNVYTNSNQVKARMSLLFQRKNDLNFPVFKNQFLVNPINQLLPNKIFAFTSFLSPYIGEILQSEKSHWFENSVNNILILTKSDLFSLSIDDISYFHKSLKKNSKEKQYIAESFDFKTFLKHSNKSFLEKELILKKQYEFPIYQPENLLIQFQKKLYKIKSLNIGIVSPYQKRRISSFLIYGDVIYPGYGTDQGGQIIHMNCYKITLRYAQAVAASPKGLLHAYNNHFVYKNSPVITLPFKTLKTGDIVQGIPKVEQYFESRTSKAGRLFLDSLPNLLQGLFKRYQSFLPLKKAVRQSFIKIQQIIIDGVQRVYRSQGVGIVDKHLEVIVRQMTSKVQIINSGKSGFFPGELFDIEFVEYINTNILTEVTYEPVVLGITRASLSVDSFLSAASFQHTTKILSKAAITKKKDFLKGLKENLMTGNLIPGGTGYIID